MNYIRLLNYSLIIFVVLQILVLKDFSKNSSEPDREDSPTESNDFFTFSGFGIEVATYNYDMQNNQVITAEMEEISGTIPLSKKSNDILLLRTSQIEQDALLEKAENASYKNIFILCDNEWENGNFVCSSENFLSRNTEQNILIDSKDNLNVGYIEENGSRYFLFPETQINNILRYPVLLNLVLGISDSQRIDEIGILNNIEIGKQNGISFFGGSFMSILFLNLLIIYVLNHFNDKLNIKRNFIRELIPFISIIPSAAAVVYALSFLPYVRRDTELTMDKLIGADISIMPNSFWILGILLLLLVGSEFNYMLLKYREKLVESVYNNIRMEIVRVAIIGILSYSLLQLARNTEAVLPQTISYGLIFSFFLFIVYINANSWQNNKSISLFPNMRIVAPFLSGTKANLIKITYMIMLVFLCGIIYQYSQPKIYAKNKIFFDPPKEYFTTPYSKLVRPYEVFHEYNVKTPDSLFVDNFIINHPKYEKIGYMYREEVSADKSLGYLEFEEKNSIKPILNKPILEILESKEPTAYFRIMNKSDIESKVVIYAKLKCNNETNSDINLEKFRLSYDKNAVVYARNAIYRKRKCTYGEEYKVNIIMNLRDISTYSDNDEILKLSSNNPILETGITPERADIQIAYLNLKKEDNYIFYHNTDSRELLILTDDENADNMEFIRDNNRINLGEAVNMLKRNRLIPNVVTIDSLNKYSLIKYIK